MSIKELRLSPKKPLLTRMSQQHILLLMLLPGLIWLIVFRYLPIYGIYMSFINYKPGGNFWSTFFTSEFVGLRWFRMLLGSKEFLLILRNTIATSLISFIVCFPAPIILALVINEAKDGFFKRFTQTASYLPHFISWVIVVNLFSTLLSSRGVVNEALKNIGLIEKPIMFFQEGKYFWFLIAFTNMWKGMGYGSILYLAAISAISPELYEAAVIDGASRLQKIWHITLPCILPTLSMILIFSISGILNAGFDQQFLMMNSMNQGYADVIDTYVYRYGLQLGMFSFASASGLFKSVVSFILLVIANLVSRKTNGHSLF